MDLFQILSAVFGLAVRFLGGYLAKIKAVMKEGEDVIKAIEEVFDVSQDALADNKLTADELRKVLKEINDVGKEAKEFLVSLKLLFNLKKK